MSGTGTDITNSTATTDVPTNYEVCQLSGFKYKRGVLIRRWDGLWVHPDFNEPKHPQEFVRSRPEHLTGSIRPEQEDVFLTTNEVQAEDL